MRKLLPGVRLANKRAHARRPDILERNRAKYSPEKRKAEWARVEVRRTQWAAHIRKKYGLIPAAFEAMIIAQCGACAMCSKHIYQSPRIDHDHKTGAVRGLLCDVCNRALGFIERYGDLANAY